MVTDLQNYAYSSIQAPMLEVVSHCKDYRTIAAKTFWMWEVVFICSQTRIFWQTIKWQFPRHFLVICWKVITLNIHQLRAALEGQYHRDGGEEERRPAFSFKKEQKNKNKSLPKGLIQHFKGFDSSFAELDPKFHTGTLLESVCHC